MLAYVVKFEPDDNGTILVTSPVFPEVATFGETEEEAADMAVAAIEEAIAARMSAGEDVPDITVSNEGPNIYMPTQTMLKVALYRSLREEDINRAELCRRMGVAREQVDRLFRLDHASRLDQIDGAFKALGRTVNIGVEKENRANAA